MAARCCCSGEPTHGDPGYDRIPDGKTAILYNATLLYSARSAMACYYNTVSERAGEGGMQVIYKTFKANVGANALGGGAMMGFVASIFALLSSYYAEEQIRLRVERVKEMMLLCGLPRPTYWFSYLTSHWLLYVVSWTVGYLVMYFRDMNGVNTHSVVCYFALGLSAGVTFIVYGYMLSFATDDVLAAQQWVTEFINLSFSIPWIVLTFAIDCTDEDNEGACDAIEYGFSVIPGFCFYRGKRRCGLLQCFSRGAAH